MKKFYEIIAIFTLLLFFSTPSSSHVQHYDKLTRIDFDIYRNNKNIGKHVFSFKRNGDLLEVESEINFEIKKLGVSLYNYYVKGTEIYENGKLVKFSSKTNQNGKDKYVNLNLKDNEFVIDGSSFKGNVPSNFMIGTWWNHNIVEANAQISAVSGRIIKQKVTFLGKEVIELNGKKFNTLHFNFSSTDKNLKKDKRLNTDIWYDEKTLFWIKAGFKKKGDWEYKLVDIK
jgi:hypothetical protein